MVVYLILNIIKYSLLSNIKKKQQEGTNEEGKKKLQQKKKREEKISFLFVLLASHCKKSLLYR